MICLSVVVRMRTAISGDIGTRVSCNGDQTLKNSETLARLCLESTTLATRAIYKSLVLCWSCLSTTPTADHVLPDSIVHTRAQCR